MLLPLLLALPSALLNPPPLGRRAVLSALPAFALPLAPLPALADGGELTASQLLTVKEYLTDLREARRGLEEVRPLLELKEDRGYEATRITIRKAPVNSIRKACSKTLTTLDKNSALFKTKTAQYEQIKVGLGALDDACRPDLANRPDALPLLDKLEASLDEFGKGLGITVVDSLDAAPAPASAEPASAAPAE